MPAIARPVLAALVAAPVLLLASCQKATHIEIEPRQPILKVRGDAVQLVGRVKSARGDFPKERVTWTSVDESIATVDDKGRVKAVKSGRTTIRATYDALVAEVPVEVSLVEGLQSEKTEVTLSFDAGDPVKPAVVALGFDGRPLRDRPVFFRSANEKVCRVDGSGQFWPTDKGETIVTAYADDKELAIKCTVGK